MSHETKCFCAIMLQLVGLLVVALFIGVIVHWYAGVSVGFFAVGHVWMTFLRDDEIIDLQQRWANRKQARLQRELRRAAHLCGKVRRTSVDIHR